MNARVPIRPMIAGALLLLICAPQGRAETKRIYIAPDDHTDYMWSADETTYRAKFLEMIDYYLSLADNTASEPAEFQSRWNCDGHFWMWTYEKNKPAADFDRLVNRIRSGHISIPLTPLPQAPGGAPAEAILRGMYYPGRIERRYNVRFPLAYSVENQTFPLGLGSLWAGAGAKYSWRGVCGCATKVTSLGDRDYPIYWWTGPDGSRVLMKWYSLTTNDSLGGYAEARDPSTAVARADAMSLTAGYPYAVTGAFGKGWDDLSTRTSEFVTVAKSMTNASRKVIVSNELDFFQDFEAAYGASLPSLSCSFGNEWDILAASLSEVTARVKRAVEKLRTAESLATLVSLRNAGFMSGRTASREQAWVDLGLYWEHDWGADGPITRSQRAAFQRRLAGEIESYVDSLYADAATALGAMIPKTGTNIRFYAFNPLGWLRTDFAEIAYSGGIPVHVVDLVTGVETPSQVVTVGGEQRLRILARDVPPVGYKVFEVRSGAGQVFPQAVTVTGNVLENTYYRVAVADRGAITGLIDKVRGNREFAATIGDRAVNDLGSGAGALQAENAGPVSLTLKATSGSPVSHTSRITLYGDIRRIDIHNEIDQNFGGTFTWGYSFNIASPDVRHEELGAVLKAKLAANGGDYCAKNARYDWLTLNHFADVTGGGVGITLSNADTSFMRVGNSTASVLDAATPQISPLAGGQVDGASLGIQGQGGDAFFLQRFSLQTHDAYDEAAAMRHAMEHQNPLATALVTGGAGYSERSHSLLSASNPELLVWALKPAEEGITQGVIMRAWNLSDSRADASVTFSWPVSSARATSHIETDRGAASFSGSTLNASFERKQMKTFRVFLVGAPTDTMPPKAPARFRVF